MDEKEKKKIFDELMGLLTKSTDNLEGYPVVDIIEPLIKAMGCFIAIEAMSLFKEGSNKSLKNFLDDVHSISLQFVENHHKFSDHHSKNIH